VPATLLVECTQFATEIVAASGSVPPVLQRLLDVAELLMAPGAVQDPLKPLLDRALSGELAPEQLDAEIARRPLRTPSPTTVAVLHNAPNGPSWRAGTRH